MSLTAMPLFYLNSSNIFNYLSAGVINGTVVELITTAGGASFGQNYNATSPPVYQSAATVSVASIACRNSDNDGDISKTTATTVDISTTGLNGVAQSANLAGTVSVTSGASGVTGSSTTFTSDFVVGDVIQTNGGQTRRITAIGSNTSMTVESNWSSTESGVNYKRGGEAKNAWYYLYAITNGSTPGLILATRNVSGGNTLVDLPSGYTKSRQLAFALKNNTSSNIMPFVVSTGWPNRPVVLYDDVDYDRASTTQTRVLTDGSATSFTDVDTSAFVPKISTIGRFFIGPTGSNQLWLRKNGYTGAGHAFSSASLGFGLYWLELPTDTSQLIEYKVESGGAMDIDVMGYVVTEVI